MKNKRLLVIGGSLLAAILIALMVVPALIDWTRYQSLAQEKLRAATGYELSINGAFSLALLPSPHANIGDVIVKKPVPGKEDAFLTFENADVRVALLPLLVGKVEVASITLEKPVVTLVTYKDGTNNYTPMKPQAAQTQAGTAPQAASAQADEGQAIAINGFNVKDGRLTLRNEQTGKTHQFGIDDLSVKADTLRGPFDGDGEISYGEAEFDVSITTGGYRAGETLPVQFNIAEKSGKAELKWSGIIATGATKEFQGEFGMGFTDLGEVLEDMGMTAIPAPSGRTQLTGMITATPERVSITNGNLQLGKTKFQSKADVTGIGSDAMAVTAAFETDDTLDVDTLMKAADEAVKEEKKEKAKEEKQAESKGAPKASGVKPLLSPTLSLPANMKADVQLRAGGLRYRNDETGAFSIRLTAAGGKGDARVTLAEIPGGGNINASATLVEKGVIDGALIGAISSPKKVLSDWLKVVDAKTFDNPAMPRRVDTDMGFRIAGYNATANFKTLSLGETKLAGTVTYTAAARPVVNAKLSGNVLTLPEAEGAKTAVKKADGDKAKGQPAEAKKMDFEFNPPQLPFDLKFDIALGRLNKGDFAVTDLRAAGAYDGKSLTLTTGNGNVNGGTISAVGTVADLKALTGIDVQAGLKTSDLESFVQAMRGTPLEMRQKIGDFAGTVKAKGDRKQMAVNANAQARGFDISASGTLDDPFSPEIPGTMAVRIRHNDLTSAIRVFSPGFGGAGSGNKPIDISGTAKISGKVYEFADMKGILGGGDIAGSLKADMSGKVPAITANITSTKLDVGALVGVDGSKAVKPSAGGAAVSSSAATPAAGAGKWSREPLDTGFMKAAVLDVKINAGTLIYGTWILSDAKVALDMKDGSLKVSPISGGLYGGTLDASLDAASGGAQQPLSMTFKADVKNVAIGPFLQALTSSTAKRADGTGSLVLDIKGSGISAGALMSSLAGSANVNTKTLIIHGMDIDKLARDIVEAFDGGWKGVLAGFGTQGFSGGQTAFKDIDQKFLITNGDMPITNFRMETTSGNAILVTNGTVSFARWLMDLRSDVQVTQPKDVPVISVRLTGPLNAPQKSVNSQALDNLLRDKLGDKAKDLLGDKLEGTKAGDAINQLLPGLLGGKKEEPAPAPTPEATPAPAETAPVAPAPVKEKSPEQQLFEGVMQQLSR